ncbi:MAG: phenylalanine--tRNA ligase subunit beta [Gammaproteobacteria bacterium]
MKFSEAWLREWVDPNIDSEELLARLTMAGLEVDGCEPVAHGCSGIVVGQVQSVTPHPDADKLRVCTVSDGKDSYQVVCGAPNVRAGMKAPFARLGAKIENPETDKAFVIKAAKLRGVESCGMLCSAEELGLGESASGLLELTPDAELGQDIRQALQLDDRSIELDLTPNRGDCLGMLGLAREVGVLTRTDVEVPTQASVSEAIGEEFPIRISAPDACPRYLGRIIRNINLDAESPLWLQEKLRRSGLRSIDPIVDVTNFVLMELGQPMHAFDYGKLQGHIDVRMAQHNEKINLLDGSEVTMTPDTLVIADAEKAVAIAGVMGGLATAVTDATTDVFLECAFFAPLAVAGKARSFGMHTDAGHRYERGVDYQLQSRAMARATQLLLEIVGGEAGPVTETTGNVPEPVEVTLALAAIPRLLGVDIDRAEVQDILGRLGFELVKDSATTITVRVPSFRFDIAIEADLIEELARVYGYNQIPATMGSLAPVLRTRPESRIPLKSINQQLVTLGYQEVVSYSFIDRAQATRFCESEERLVSLQNPISQDMAVMRPSIMPGLLGSLAYNINRHQGRARLFESGLVFAKESGNYLQPAMLAGLITGSRYPENWSNNKDISNFYDAKGDVEALLSSHGRDAGYQFTAATAPGLHQGQCARIEGADGLLGYVGALHPAIQRDMGFSHPVYLFELLLEGLQSGQVPRSTELSRYPQVSRDLALVVEEEVSAREILALVRKNAGEALTDLRIFDVYQGDAIEKGKKSLALGLTWQHPSRTLSDEEINAIISSCINALQKQFNANLRK